MKEVELSPLDRYHLRNLVECVNHLKRTDNVKQWLSIHNHRLLAQLFKIEDELDENFIKNIKQI